MNAAGNPRKILVNPKFKNKVVNQQPPVRLLTYYKSNKQIK